MTMTGILRTVLRHVPDALVPGTRPDTPHVQHGHVGEPVSRLDGALKVRGQARFFAEVALERLLYASVVHSTIARGRIATLDTAAAEAAPGVAVVMTYRNAPRLKAPEAFGEGDGVAGSNLPVMQDDQVHWNGEAVAVVLAETQEQADHAAGLVAVTYVSERAVTDFTLAKARDPGDVLGEPAIIETGDAEKALAAAAHHVDATYTTPILNHNAIELHGATAAWSDGTLVVHDATQMITSTAVSLAKVFGLKPAEVRVLSPFVGGGFGGKGLWSHQILAAAAAKLAGRPVRLVLSREGVYRLVGGRTRTMQRVALAATQDGRLDALIHSGVAAMTAHNNCPEQFTFPARHLYAARTLRVEQKVADMDMLANTWMRAPGESIGTFALESAIDELAHEMRIDPIELRRRWEPERDPTTGAPHSARHLVKAYADGATRFGWERREATPGRRRDGEWLLGMGVATATYPYYRFPGVRARLKLDVDGGLTVSTAGHEMGMGTATVQAQHAADRLGVALDNVSFEYGDSTLPAGAMAGGSAPMEQMKYSMHSTGAQFAEVGVNEVTGEVRVRRFLGSFDVGRILNPKTAASQFRGGIIMGMGLALSEATLLDPRSGRVMNPSLAEYHVPVHLDVPEIEVMWTDIPDPQAPLGARGIGEIGITGTAAAIANAVFNATGKRVRDLPITLDKLL